MGQFGQFGLTKVMGVPQAFAAGAPVEQVIAIIHFRG